MRLRMRTGAGCLACGVVLALAFPGGAGAQMDKSVEGTCGSIFSSKICTSYQMRAGKISELTLRVPIAVIENAPANPPMEWPPKADLEIAFAPAVQKQTGFTFASVYWEAHGHPPAAFMVPHFDFHFYFAPRDKMNAVDCKDTTKPHNLPANYILPDLEIPHRGTMVGTCIPGMGMHAFANTDLADGKAWQGSVLVGYYGGEPIFFEPMLSNALLLEKHSFELVVPQGISEVANIRYPKRFRALYLPRAAAYEFTFFY